MFRCSIANLAKLPPATFFNALNGNGHKAFFGVPDSLLKDFCAYVTENAPSDRHIIAANEGNAVGLACGYHLATNEVPVVYLQNSGVGNMVNPLLSLAHEQVYKMPMLLLIGWRGDPAGKKDEPQHIAQGRLTPMCLDACEIPHSVIEPTDNVEGDMTAALAKASAHFAAKGTPYGLLIKRDTFESYKMAKKDDDAMAQLPLSREQAIEAILNGLGPRDAVVSTTGMPSREVFECRARAKAGHHRDFLTVGGMGHCSSIAAGMAVAMTEEEAASRDVLALDGDGAALMHLGAFPVTAGVAKASPKKLANFKHVVVNNGAHDSVGGQPTVGTALDFTAIARTSGYALVRDAAVSDAAALDAAMKDLKAAKGPAFLEVRVRKGNRADLGRPTTTPQANKEDLMKFLSEKA